MAVFLNGLWQGALLTATIWFLLRLTPRLNAATRFVVCWATLLGVLILPLRGLWAGFASDRGGTPVASDRTDASQNDSNRAVPARIASARVAPAYGIGGPLVVTDRTPTVGVAGGSRHWYPIPLAAGPVWEVMGGVWILTSAGLLIRLVRAYQSLRRIKRRAAEAPAYLQARLREVRRKAGVGRKAHLLVSDEVATPMVLGLARPAIVIPRTLSERMSEADFDHIAMHELAHLQRYDDWTNLLEKVIEALLPIQPAVMWIGRWMGPEREAACDDWVIGVTGTPKPYVTSLARIAEITLGAKCGMLASGAIGHPSQLYRRVHRMLDRRQDTTTRVSALRAAFGVAAVIFLAAAAMYAPPMIAFAEAAPEAGTIAATQPVPNPGPAPKPGDVAVTNWVGQSEFTQAQAFAVNPGDKLVVDVDLGSVHLSTWDQNNVSISVRTKGPGLVEFLKHHHTTMNQQGAEVRLSAAEDEWPSDQDTQAPATQRLQMNTNWNTNFPRISPRLQIEYEIQVPKKFSADIKSGAGNADVSNLDGTVVVTSGAGNLRLKDTRGIFVVHTGAGNVELKDASGTFTVNTGAGNMDATRCAGILNITTGAGNIGVSRFTGNSIQANTGFGNVTADLSSPPKADCSFQTGIGNVTLKLPKSAAVTLNPSTGMGRVSSESGPVNGGGPSIRLKTGTGNVQIIRQ